MGRGDPARLRRLPRRGLPRGTHPRPLPRARGPPRGAAGLGRRQAQRELAPAGAVARRRVAHDRGRHRRRAPHVPGAGSRRRARGRQPALSRAAARARRGGWAGGRRAADPADDSRAARLAPRSTRSGRACRSRAGGGRRQGVPARGRRRAPARGGPTGGGEASRDARSQGSSQTARRRPLPLPPRSRSGRRLSGNAEGTPCGAPRSFRDLARRRRRRDRRDGRGAPRLPPRAVPQVPERAGRTRRRHRSPCRGAARRGRPPSAGTKRHSGRDQPARAGERVAPTWRPESAAAPPRSRQGTLCRR